MSSDYALETELKKLYFLSFCIEQYKHVKNIDGRTIKELFDKFGVTEFLLENYDVLHTQSREWILEEIETFLKNHGE